MVRLKLFLLTLSAMIASSSGQRGSLPEALRNLKTVDATTKGTTRTDTDSDDTHEDEEDDVADPGDRKVPEKNTITKLMESFKKRPYKTSAVRLQNSSEPLSILKGYVPLDGKTNRIHAMREQLCTAIPFNHTVSHEGCASQTILNNMCAGFCNSVSVPLATSELSVYSSCGPLNHEELGIRLLCRGRKRGYKIKKIHMVRGCACSALRSY